MSVAFVGKNGFFLHFLFAQSFLKHLVSLRTLQAPFYNNLLPWKVWYFSVWRVLRWAFQSSLRAQWCNLLFWFQIFWWMLTILTRICFQVNDSLHSLKVMFVYRLIGICFFNGAWSLFPSIILISRIIKSFLSPSNWFSFVSLCERFWFVKHSYSYSDV